MRKPAPAPAGGNGLAEVMAVERRLAARVAAAREAASATVDRARAEADRAAAAAGRDLAVELERLRDAARADRERRLAARRAAAERRRLAWAEIDEDRVAAAAAGAVAALVRELAADGAREDDA